MLQFRAPRHKFDGAFLFSPTCDPVVGHFGALPFIYGTGVTSGLALLVSVPLGVGAAAVSSAIYGLRAIFVVVPIRRDATQPFL